MVEFNPQFIQLMNANNFKRIDDCKREGVKLPSGLSVPQIIAEREFVRLNKDNPAEPYDLIHVDPTSKEKGGSYYMYQGNSRGGQDKISPDAMSLEELSARISVNSSVKNREERSHSENNSKTIENTTNSKSIKKELDTEKRIADISKRSEEAKKNGLTFKDIGGQDAAIEKMKKTVLFPIKYPEAFAKRKISHGVVLYGPPGTGKSLLAETLANESHASFIKLNGLEMISKWHGQSEENLRKLFEQAKENQPAIIFIDEFDGIASKRDRERDPYGAQVVNQLLTLLSDIEKGGDNIFVVAATNRLDLLDSAITRSGRMETHIELLPPKSDIDTLQILDIHTKNMPLDENLNKPAIAEILLAHKASGADIASIVNDANEQAYSRQNETPDGDFDDSIYEKMENGTFNLEDLHNVKITNDDFEVALQKRYGKNIHLRPLLNLRVEG